MNMLLVGMIIVAFMFASIVARLIVVVVVIAIGISVYTMSKQKMEMMKILQRAILCNCPNIDIHV